MSAIDRLQERLGCTFANLAASRREAAEQRAKLAARVEAAGLLPVDTSLVVFGSLARDEWTGGSDLDWALLVDGQADPVHTEIVRRMRDLVGELGFKDPGPTGVFGGLAFSHELVHRIGGEADTNRNITQRILLLLESRAIGASRAVRDRVLRALLERYLIDDIVYHERLKVRVPRFLLNDVVRYWRTMAVDYAMKRRERPGAGWALRNAKLRLSRKLIFAAGLLACQSCEAFPSDVLRDDTCCRSAEVLCAAMVEHLVGFTERSPLETLSETLLMFGLDKLARDLLDTYDAFVGMLRDDSIRKHLHDLRLEKAAGDELLRRAKQLGTAFQEGLVALFFRSNDQLAKATQEYGVF